MIDFGISGGQADETTAGTLLYSPPEVVSGKHNESDTRIDIWALGVMLYYILTKSYPFIGESREQTRKKIIKDHIVFPKSLSHEVQDLIYNLLRKRRERRIDFHEIYNHPWLRGVRLTDEEHK